jgi:hypothetical protein
VRYLGWVRLPDEPSVLFRMAIERGGQHFQTASVTVDDKILVAAELEPPDDQLGTALVLEVAHDIEQAVVDGTIPLADPTMDYAIPPVPEARVRQIIAADDTAVVHTGGLVFTFDQADQGDPASSTA